MPMKKIRKIQCMLLQNNDKKIKLHTCVIFICCYLLFHKTYYSCKMAMTDIITYTAIHDTLSLYHELKINGCHLTLHLSRRSKMYVAKPRPPVRVMTASSSRTVVRMSAAETCNLALSAMSSAVRLGARKFG